MELYEISVTNLQVTTAAATGAFMSGHRRKTPS